MYQVTGQQRLERNPLPGQGQDIVSQRDTIPGLERLQIRNFDRSVFEVRDSGNVQYLYGNVRAFQDSTFFFSDTAMLTDGALTAWGNVTILQADTIKIFADSLYYNRDSSFAELHRNVVFINGDQQLTTHVLYYNIKEKIAYYTGGAILARGNSKLQSRRGRYEANSKMSFFERDVRMMGPDLVLRTEALIYMMEEDKVIFVAPVRMQTSDATIYCEKGFFFMGEKKGEFEVNAQYTGDDRKVTGDKIVYNDQTKDVLVEGKAVFITEDGWGSAEILEYSENNADIILLGDAYFFNQENEVKGERIIYNDETGDLFVAGNAYLSREQTTIEAYNIQYNEKLGIGNIEGKIVWTDTVSKIQVICDLMDILGGEYDEVKAYNYVSKPLMMVFLEKDTMFITSDTLTSIEYKDSLENVNKLLIGDNDVVIYKHDIQARSDSMTYFITDSVFVLTQNPFMWSDSTQFSADTISIFLKDDKVDKVIMSRNSLIINTEDLKFFNQIQGREVVAYFVDNAINNFVVQGNAMSIYYVKEGDAYSGVNVTECSTLRFDFRNNEISDIRGYKDVKQKMTPMLKADHNSLKLDGFIWIFDKKPQLLKDFNVPQYVY